MSKNYIDLVTINGLDGRKYVRTAPSWSRLEEGDEVMFQVDGHPFEIKGNVLFVETFHIEGDTVNLLKSFAKDVDLRITKKITYTEMDYSEYDEPEVVEEQTEATEIVEEGEVANG